VEGRSGPTGAATWAIRVSQRALSGLRRSSRSWAGHTQNAPTSGIPQLDRRQADRLAPWWNLLVPAPAVAGEWERVA